MSVYRITIMWNQSVMGVSESYYTPNQSPQSAAKNVETMLGLRNQAMFDDQYWVGVRASIEGSNRNSSPMLPSAGLFADSGMWINIPVRGVQVAGTLSPANEQLRAVLQEQVLFAGTRRTIKYLSGIPKDFVGTEPATIRFGGDPAWYAALQQFQAYLISSGWQIKAQPVGAGAPTAAVVGLIAGPAPANELGVRVRSASMPGWSVGDRVYASHFRPAKGTRASTLNGTWYVDSLDSATYAPDVVIYLRGSNGIVPAAQRFTDKTFMRLVSYTYYPIDQIVNYRVGIHKRGRPSMAPHGRRTRIPSLDA